MKKSPFLPDDLKRLAAMGFSLDEPSLYKLSHLLQLHPDGFSIEISRNGRIRLVFPGEQPPSASSSC